MPYYLNDSNQNLEIYDDMTGLYKIGAFFLASEKLYRSNTEIKYAMLQIDIYHFKIINEVCGVEKANKLLLYIADLIKKCVGTQGVGTHLRADVFGMCIPFQQKEELVEVISKLLKQISEYTTNCNVLPAIGVCIIDDISLEPHLYFDRTSIALQKVKGNTLKKYAFYMEEDKRKLVTEIKIQSAMEDALRQGEFKIFIQPKVNIRTGEIIGGEALVRWEHKKEGLLRPDEFIPIFEKNGFIIKLDEYVWERVFQVMQGWLNKGIQPVPISVNISRVNVCDSNFAKKLVSLVRIYKVKPKLVPLELTESAFLENTNNIYDFMKRLQVCGFVFSMDDYGSGYSSINMLKNIAVDEVKLDQLFLKEETLSERTRIVLKYSLDMLKELNTKVIVEGVETKEQVEFLKSCNCNYAQGYYFYKPMPIEEFEKLVYRQDI